MAVTSDIILRQSQAYAVPELAPNRATELAIEVNSLLEKATPLIERYRYLYADPFSFLAALEEQAIPETGENGTGESA